MKNRLTTNPFTSKMGRFMTVIILTLAMLMMLFSGCTAGGTTSGSKTLMVYVLNMNPKRWLECDVWGFNFPGFQKEHEGIDIVTEEFTSIEALETQLLRELSNGGGPDVILYSWQNTFDIYKLAADGLFVDLNIYLKEDDTFQRGDYTESLLDAGVTGGAQYLMPVGYTIPVILTSEEKLADAGVTYTGEALSGRELLRLVESEGERLADDEKHFSFIDLQQGNSGMTFFDYSGLISLDYETRTASADPDAFYELMQLYVPFSNELNRSLNALTKNGPGSGFKISTEELLEKGTIFHATFNPLQEMLYNAFTIEFSLNEMPVLQMQSSFESAGSYCVDPLIAAINRNSAEPEAAYALIRYLMDHTVQQGADGIAPGSYLSVNKSVSTAYLQNVLHTLNPSDNSAWDAVSQQFETVFNAFLNSELRFSPLSTLRNIVSIRPCLEAAAESRAAFDAAFDVMLADFEAYLNE